jgi:hypothetical protein
VGKKVKLVSDPALAQPHEAGSKLRLTLPCVHVELGALFVAQVPHYAVHLAFARQLRPQLSALDAQIEALSVQSSGGREVSDPMLVSNLYFVGTNLAIHTVLALHHLVLWLEQLSPGDPRKADLTSRLGAALKRLGNRIDLNADPRYARLSEIENIRHAIEHPNPDNVYTADVKGWDRIPLTWTASGRAAAAFDQADEFLEEIAAFAKKVEGRRKGPNVFVNVKRGMKSVNPATKPRRRP